MVRGKTVNRSNKKLLILIPVIAVGSLFGKWWEGFATYKTIATERINHAENVTISYELIAERIADFELIAETVKERVIPSQSIEPVQSYIRQVFGKDAIDALKVAKCESNYRPHALGGVGERGVFQIHPIHTRRIESLGWSFNDMFDYKKNTRLAYILFKEQGWGPWTCRKALNHE